MAGLGGAGLDAVLAALKAAGDPTRLRLLAICCEGEWTVSELVQVMGQSQPRISRHLKLLAGAGLLERFREGSWVFYRQTRGGEGARLAQLLARVLPPEDPQLERDRQRLAAVREARRVAAERWFDGRAEDWDSERDLAVDGAEVEDALLGLFAAEPPQALLDIGTGTGRILSVLAGHVESGLGVDASHDMLRVARANLDRAEARHCQVRHGDMYRLPLPDGAFDAVTLHQVLHFADDPPAVLAEARRVLRGNGRLVIVDLGPHEEEQLRIDKQHRRLGFSEAEVAGWLAGLGLEVAPVIRLAGQRLAVHIWTGRAPGLADHDRPAERAPGGGHEAERTRADDARRRAAA